jgi:hypothetical protein
MKKYTFWMIASAALLVPALARGLWFYRGIAPQRPKIQTPDYQALAADKLPLQVPEEEKDLKQVGGMALLDFAHANQFQPHEVQSLREELEKRGGRVETLSDPALLAYKLKYASAYIVVSPSIMFTADEIRLAQDFVARGGRLLVFSDATRGVIYSDFFSGTTVNYSDAAAVNPLLAPHGITLNNDYLYNTVNNDGNFRNVFFEKFGKHELTFGLKQVAFYGTHSLKSQNGTLLLRADKATRSSIDDAHNPAAGGAALSADGNVLAFGDFTFLGSPYHNAADNATLIANIADFVLGGKRELTLQNFPFLFKQSTAQVYPSSEVTLTAETISALGGLQKSLDTVSVALELVAEAPDAGDTIILGTFTPSADLEDYLAPFDLTLPAEEDEYLALPTVGKIGRYGNGVLLFERGKKGNTLILLADTPDDLIALINTVASGTLDGCVLQGNIGICGVGYSSGDYSGEEEATPEPGAEGEATPAPEASG